MGLDVLIREQSLGQCHLLLLLGLLLEDLGLGPRGRRGGLALHKFLNIFAYARITDQDQRMRGYPNMVSGSEDQDQRWRVILAKAPPPNITLKTLVARFEP